MKDIQHILRMAGVFVVVISGFLLVRHLLVPASFGLYGHYRAAAIDDIKALPISFVGQKECAKCHGPRVQEKNKGGHRNLGCETCHGALAAHAAAPAKSRPVRVAEKDMRAFCERCHAASFSRPAKFPQINPDAHNPGAACNSCHNPHSPRL